MNLHTRFKAVAPDSGPRLALWIPLWIPRSDVQSLALELASAGLLNREADCDSTSAEILATLCGLGGTHYLATKAERQIMPAAP